MCICTNRYLLRLISTQTALFYLNRSLKLCVAAKSHAAHFVSTHYRLFLESGLVLLLTVLRPSDCKYVCLCDGVGGPEDDNPVHLQQRSVCCCLKMQAQRVIQIRTHDVHESLCLFA